MHIPKHRPRHRLQSLTSRRAYPLRAADALASSATEIAVPLIVLRATGSAAWSGLSFCVEWVLRLAVIPNAGALVDRLGPGAVYRVASVVRTLAGAALLLVLLAHPDAWWCAAGFGIVSGLSFEATFIAAESVGARLAAGDPERVPRIQAVQTAIDEAARMAGPVVAAGLLLAGPGAAVAAITLASAVVTVLCWPLGRSAVTEAREPAEPAEGGVRAGLTTVLRRPDLRRVAAVYSASNLLYGVVMVAAPPLLLNRYGCPSTVVGALWACGFCLSLAGVAAAGRGLERVGADRAGAVAFAVLSTAGVIAGTVRTAPAFFAAAALVLGTLGAVQVHLRTIRARAVPAENYGGVTAAVVLTGLLPNPVSGLLVAAAPTADLPTLILLAAVVTTAVNTAALRGLGRAVRRHTAEPSTPIPVPAPPFIPHQEHP